MAATTSTKPLPPGLRQPLGPSNPVLSKVIIVDFDGERDEHQRPIGQGRATFKHGHTYDGDFVDGWMHGKGIFVWSDGTKYQGSFVRNTIEGTGKFEWVDGSYYEGGVLGGIRHGQGKMQVASKRVIVEIPEGFRRPEEEPEYTEEPGPCVVLLLLFWFFFLMFRVSCFVFRVRCPCVTFYSFLLPFFCLFLFVFFLRRS